MLSVTPYSTDMLFFDVELYKNEFKIFQPKVVFGVEIIISLCCGVAVNTNIYTHLIRLVYILYVKISM